MERRFFKHTKKRIPPEKFNIPVEKIKKGFFTDVYFNRTREILRKDRNNTKVTMQIFSRGNGILCGIDEAIGIIKTCANNPDKLKIKALYDGDEIVENEVVMVIEGRLVDFVALETVYLGVLSRGTSIASAMREIVEVAENIPVLYFGSRFDHYLTQISDGYAALIGGASAVSTDANGFLKGEQGVGTIPHALIAVYQGDTVEATKKFDQFILKKIPRVALVDFENNCVKTSIEVAKELKGRLWGVRLDTAGNLIDIKVRRRDQWATGVCPELVFKVRKELDKAGFKNVKIVVSGGFNKEKVLYFKKRKTPIDAIGVGSSLFRNKIDFTADVVRPTSKVGREYNWNPELEDVR